VDGLGVVRRDDRPVGGVPVSWVYGFWIGMGCGAACVCTGYFLGGRR
jgi:hypothetical protein